MLTVLFLNQFTKNNDRQSLKFNQRVSLDFKKIAFIVVMNG